MFRKDDFLDSLMRDLCRARDRRDALSSDVTALTAQISELEARFSEAKERRDREQLAMEIAEVKKHLEETAQKAVPLIAKLAAETERASAIVPDAREVQKFLAEVTTEVETVIGSVVSQLQRQAEELHAAQAAQPLPQPQGGAPEPPKNNAVFAWLRRAKKTGSESHLRQESGDAAPIL